MGRKRRVDRVDSCSGKVRGVQDVHEIDAVVVLSLGVGQENLLGSFDIERRIIEILVQRVELEEPPDQRLCLARVLVVGTTHQGERLSGFWNKYRRDQKGQL